ncbi:MAG: S41 family peptidase [Steroidobacteraceae bacterium]
MLSGLWRSEGYGWILSFDETGYTLYHATRVNCIATEHGSHEDFVRSYDRIELSGADALSLHQAGDITRYRFRRIAQLPDVAVLASPGQCHDPVISFDTLWQLFDEHYAFFDLHRVDWLDLYRRQRPRVSATMTDPELFAVFCKLLESFDDGHVTLAAPGQFYQRMRSMDLRRAMQAAFGTPTGLVTPRTTVDAISARIEDILLAPFDTTRTPLKRACNAILSWCELEPDIGYVSMLRLFGFADSEAARQANGLPHARRAVADFLREDCVALETALDAIFTDLRRCRGVILDLRINGGGFDRAGLTLAGRFADRRRLAYSKRAKAGAGYTQEQEIYMEPRGKGFAGPVAVLTSPLCISAGEVCVLALRALPQISVMGQSTAGMLSDNLNKPLPNGWELSLSNEIYTSCGGAVFEGRGITPDVPDEMDAANFVPALRASLVSAVDLLGRGAPIPLRHGPTGPGAR